MPTPTDPAPADDGVYATLAGADALDAWRFASEHHAGQLRPVLQAPFIHHPERVAILVAEEGGTASMVKAALLHDLLEDTDVESGDIEDRFGAEVAQMVCALSDDPEITDYEERKHALCGQVREAGRDAALIYAADKLANAADLRAALAEVGIPAESRLKVPFAIRVKIWRDDLDMCRELLGPDGLTARLELELDALEREREALGPAESVV
jgi:(p)ppGpp synthase/HD superfamily hydrolase